MDNIQEIEKALRGAVPAEFQEHIPLLASLLQEALESDVQTHPQLTNNTPTPELKPVLDSLAGKELHTGSALIRFGDGNQIGDIQIKSIAGGNITTNNTIELNVNLNKISVQKKSRTGRKNSSHIVNISSSSYPRRSTRQKSVNPVANNTRNARLASRFNGVHVASSIATMAFVGIKVAAFAVIGFWFGWDIIVIVTNTQYLYQHYFEPSRERIITGLGVSLLGVLVGFSFLAPRRRVRRVPWWGHIAGVLMIGAISYAAFREWTMGAYSVGGVIGWLVLWLSLFGGHKEIR